MIERCPYGCKNALVRMETYNPPHKPPECFARCAECQAMGPSCKSAEEALKLWNDVSQIINLGMILSKETI